MKNKTGYGKYNSKVKRVNIPIPSFEYVHKSWLTGQKGTATPGFMIGRDRIIEKLKTWLIKEKSNGGSYLITGYRGMGKTSFVDRVLYELVGEATFWTNLTGFLAFLAMGISGYGVTTNTCEDKIISIAIIIGCILLLFIICKQYYLKEKFKKYKYRIKAGLRFAYRHKGMYNVWECLMVMRLIGKGLKAKEWDRINSLVYGSNLKDKRYSHICVNVNLGQEILDERSILCVLTSQLYDKYRAYVLSPIANVEMWIIYAGTITASIILCINTWDFHYNGTWMDFFTSIINVTKALFIISISLGLTGWHQLRILSSLRILRKRIDAEMKTSESIKVKYESSSIGTNMEYSYPIANIRDIESQLIALLDRIERFPIHPTFYFVFDELDKIETPLHQHDDSLPEYSNEKYLSTGGTSRKRKFMVMHLLANMKYFTTTAKAKFIFIAGREMYDAYLADLTDREAAVSSLFNGVIYVESFCKNEKSEKDVMYNTETFIARQLLPRQFIADKVMDKFIECKLRGKFYTNIDINLKLYFEYLTLVYTDKILGSKLPEEERIQFFEDARACIDKTVGLLYHFTVYLYHISNGSPKKIRLNFENRIRPLRDKSEFRLTKTRIEKSPLEGMDLDIYIPERCKYLLSLGDKEQRVIGFIHYISFPVNQIITDANQFGDKLLVSACFLINHLYKHHSGGFSWRNIEQTPELLEVYKIPEFRGFINSILTYLLQTHIIQIPCGLYQFKFRKQISEEISLASKFSEEVSAIFNFTLDESQSVKRHYMEILKKHLKTLQEEKVSSPHSIAGLHHILADLYMADEEYNQAIFEFQNALSVLKQIKATNEDSHQATFILTYIRIMLKLGNAFEKRKTYASAYNTYNEIIHLLTQFREFDEKKFGLNYVVTSTHNWPYQDAVLYNENIGAKRSVILYDENTSPIRKVIPIQMLDKSDLNGLAYMTKGSHMISDFSYQMTPEKHAVIQRLAMLEDTQIVYQALLAKLFINEKIELGGITRSNLDLIEGEYRNIHLTTNEKEKFLISTDFFRRLGDIMFYKNGLVGFNYHYLENSSQLNEPFVDSLYYWAFNIQTEIHDYCTEHNCHELKEKMLEEARKLKAYDFENMQSEGIEAVIKKEAPYSTRMTDFWKQRTKRLEKLPIKDIENCNNTRKNMWIKNRTMPCVACKYYNRSLRIIMENLFGIEAEKSISKKSGKRTSKTIQLLELIVRNGSAKSMRQNHMIQFAEVLDCLGNTILSCANFEKDYISSQFLSQFLHDAEVMNQKMDGTIKDENYELLDKQLNKLSKLETCILYYWEAYIGFRYGREQKKAFGSLKKILRVIQNYLRVAEICDNDERIFQCQTTISEYLDKIKDQIIKQALICLYSHYNFINAVEIQQLKWIFYTQMYENISLNRLSLFPDVEEVMLIYYEIVQLCIIDNKLIEKNVKTNEATSKQSIEDNNEKFNNLLISLYNNMSMGALRHENTIYERILSLRMKMILNRHILFMAFPDLQSLWEQPLQKEKTHAQIFIEQLTDNEKLKDCNESWKDFFPDKQFYKGENDIIHNRLQLLEFLIKDSIYCLTYILETITPYTTTTLFTHSFLASTYYSLNKWNVLFDTLFWYYKFFDEKNPLPEICRENDRKREELFKEYDDKIKQKYQSTNNSHVYIESKSKTTRFEKNREVMESKLREEENIINISNIYQKIWGCHNLSDRFFESILDAINKHNIQNTLTNYSCEMALKSYCNVIEVHREQRAYKEMISRMFYLDDDLKNDTIQFDLAIERFKINSNHINNCIKSVTDVRSGSIYDIENFRIDNETKATLKARFPDLFWNFSKNEVSEFLNKTE